jgi:hypothetical protein
MQPPAGPPVTPAPPRSSAPRPGRAAASAAGSCSWAPRLDRGRQRRHGEPVQVADHATTGHQCALGHAGGSILRVEELVQHEVASVTELTGDPVPTQRLGARAEVAPLVIEPAQAGESDVATPDRERCTSGQAQLRVIGRASAGSLDDQPLMPVQDVGTCGVRVRARCSPVVVVSTAVQRRADRRGAARW